MAYDHVFELEDIKNEDRLIFPDLYKPKKFTQAEAKKKSAAQIGHTIACQEVHVHGIKLGYKWEPTRALPGQNETKASGLRWGGYPDGLLIDKKTTAVEIELTKKTPSAYYAICRNHLINMEKGRYDNVLYFVKTERCVAPFRITLHKAFSKNDISLYLDGEKVEPEKIITRRGLFTVASLSHLRSIIRPISDT